MDSDDRIYSELLARASSEAGRGNLTIAISACQKAIGQQPKRPEAWYNRGILRRMQGDASAALDDLSAAVRLAPDRVSYAIEWQNTLTSLAPGKLPGPVASAALLLMESKLIDLQDSVRHISAHVKFLLGPALKADGDWGGPLWKRACDPFVLAYLAEVLNTDAELEHYLVKLLVQLTRQLRQEQPSPALWNLVAAMVRQLDRNGHVLVVAEPEPQPVLGVRGAAIRALRGERVSVQSAWPSEAGALISVLAALETERKEEAELAATLPRLGSGAATETSRVVRGQYEDFPYPRWRRPVPVLAGAKLEEIGHLMPERAGRPVGNVLIAGCGTGRQAVGASVAYGGAPVTAIDLSGASLAYAMRQARAIGIRDIRFIQCDLLECGLLGTSFDVVECVGVLHHMGDPLAGLRALTRVLGAGGVIKIGLYSRAARAQLDPFRSAVAQMDGPMDQRIRKLRQALLTEQIGTAEERSHVLDSMDFYALQEAIDLLGHVHERELTLAEVGTLLEQAGLVFRGFSLGDPRPETHFRDVHGRPSRGAPLSDWEEVERLMPDTFRGMYNFWAERAIG